MQRLFWRAMSTIPSQLKAVTNATGVSVIFLKTHSKEIIGRKGNDNKRNASDRTSGSESEKKRLKTRTGQQTSTLPIDEGGPKMSSPTTLAPEVIAQHVAGHLRTIMLLTLRIISIDGPVEVSSDKESVSGKTDDQLSRVASSRDDLGERSDISATSSYPGELAEGYQLQHLEDTVPDHDEIITWDDVCGKEDVRVDDILQPAVKQGAFQSWTNSKDERSLYEKDEQAPLDTEAYAIAWRAFERRLSKREQHLSQRAFQWVLCSHDSLSTPELSMAMLIDPNSDEVDELNGEAERLLRKGGIKDLCGSLLSLDPEHDIWGFKHHAAADYFTANHCDYSQACAFVGMACLKFLITDPCVANKTNCRSSAY
ncbi:hypothetical protein N0V84_002172 [Fusarium piperis]|uniref:Uncharacterized protein n=1 Tax=Fusarium piperis TaxID=1435070 RepID=A0A9W8WK33_9HYPO|nr:hypothetical protein N0V84_002172 [Fusarium piperis]